MLYSVVFVSYIFFCVLFLCLLHGFCFLFFFFFFFKKCTGVSCFSVLVSFHLLYIFVWRFCFLYCLVSFCVQCEINVCLQKKKKTQLKKINKVKSPVNLSSAAYDVEKLKINVECVLSCILRVISEKGFNTTLFPGGLPPQY